MIVRYSHVAGMPPITTTFNPLTSIAWLHAFWAEDPAWTHPANGAFVSSWRDAGTAAADAVQGTAGSQPIYNAALAALNNRPAVQFNASHFLQCTTAGTFAQPNHVYAVATTGSGSNCTLIDSMGTGRQQVRTRTSNILGMFAGVQYTFSNSIAGVIHMACLFNGAASEMRCNGFINIVGLNAGTDALDDLRIGNDITGTVALTGNIAFLAVKDTALTNEELAALSAWAQSRYGVPAL